MDKHPEFPPNSQYFVIEDEFHLFRGFDWVSTYNFETDQLGERARFIIAAVAMEEWRQERDRIVKEAGWGDYESLLASGPGYITEPRYRDAYDKAHKEIGAWRQWGANG